MLIGILGLEEREVNSEKLLLNMPKDFDSNGIDGITKPDVSDLPNGLVVNFESCESQAAMSGLKGRERN